MDINIRLQQCFAKLGYFGTIPIDLQSNPSTSFIWEQFIANVKPRNEVNVCRKNIIINRLQRKSDVKNHIEYPIRETEVYNELQVVKQDVDKIKMRIQKKQSKEVFLHEANKSNYLQISSLKEHIEEKKIKLHILKLKCIDLENEIKQIDEVVNSRGLSLVPDEDSLDSETVSNLFLHIVDKIEKLSDSQEFPRINQNRYMMSSHYNASSSLPPPKNSYSTIKKNKNNSSTIQKFKSCANINAVKSLFIDSFKENQMNIGNVSSAKTNDSKLLDQSAQLLPDSCFDFKPDDEFLMSFPFEDDVFALEEHGDLVKMGSVFDNSLSCASIPEVRHKRDYVKKARTDECVMQNINEILHGASVRIIWTSLCNLREHLLRDIRIGLESCNTNIRFKNNESNKEDINKLNFIYVKNNLLTLKSKKKIKQLMEAISREKSHIEVQLGGQMGEDKLKGLEQMLESVKLEAAIQFMLKEINNNKKTDTVSTLNSLNAKINKAKEELFTKIKEVDGYMEAKEDLMQQLKRCQEDTTMWVRKLSKFIYHTAWAEGLTEDVHSKEINVFREFPLDYNKKFCFTDKDVFYRDSMRNVILDQDTPNDTVYMLSSVVGHPQYTPERIFIETLEKKQKFQIMSSLKFPEVKIEHKNYSVQELQEKEKYVDEICETLNSNIRSSKTYQVLNSLSRMKLNMQLWSEIPFRRFISKERTVEGKTYKEYEEKFDYLRSNK